MIVRAVVKLAEQSEKVVGLMEKIVDTQGVILQELRDLRNHDKECNLKYK
jgi:hypothetical protein